MATVDPALVVFLGLAAGVYYISERVGLPSVPGFMVLGFLLGPVSSVFGTGALPKVDPTGELVTVISELGLIFLLFLVGLEVKFEEISSRLEAAVSMSMVQSVGVVAASYALLNLLGFGTSESAVLAVALTPSSAAVVVPTLSQRNEISSSNGVLDLSVLVLESVLMVLVLGAVSSLGGELFLNLGKVAASVAAAGVLSWAGYRFLAPEVMSRVSDDMGSFLVAGLGFLSVFLLFSEFAGLRPEVGAFFAGVSIAQLPYSSELHAQVKPLTEFFLAVFLGGLGLGVAPSSLSALWKPALALSAMLIPLKSALYFVSARARGVEGYVSARSALDLSQVSDLALVVGGAALGAGLLGSEHLALLTLVALMTMSGSSLLIRSGDALVSRFFEKEEEAGSEPSAILVGLGDIGSEAMEVLETHFGRVVVVARSVGLSEEAEGHESVFGSFEHEDVRKKAGFGSAKAVVSLEEDLDMQHQLLDEAPECPVVVSSESVDATLELLNSGADYVLNEEILADREFLERVNGNE